ncbi:MAG: DUF6758 family protein [Marmoricola sp.]
MGLEASCPRCPAPLAEEDGCFRCGEHGTVDPLWRPNRADYESFAEVLGRLRGLPTYLPWPMSPGWSVADFGCVGDGSVRSAAVTTTVGSSDPDGRVSVCVVTEDPGVGLGARCAGAPYVDPGDQIGAGTPVVRVRAAGRPVPLWSVDVSDDDPLTRAVFAGEAHGRWLWLVLRPASAALLLHDEWLLADVSGLGPQAVEMPFGGTPPDW